MTPMAVSGWKDPHREEHEDEEALQAAVLLETSSSRSFYGKPEVTDAYACALSLCPIYLCRRTSACASRCLRAFPPLCRVLEGRKARICEQQCTVLLGS